MEKSWWKSNFSFGNVEFIRTRDYASNCFEWEKALRLFLNLPKCSGNVIVLRALNLVLNTAFLNLNQIYVWTLFLLSLLLMLLQDYIRILNRPLVLSKTNDFFQTTFFSRDHLVGDGCVFLSFKIQFFTCQCIISGIRIRYYYHDACLQHFC